MRKALELLALAAVLVGCLALAAFAPLVMGQTVAASPPPAPSTAQSPVCAIAAQTLRVGVSISPPGSWAAWWCDDGHAWRLQVYAANYAELGAQRTAALKADLLALVGVPTAQLPSAAAAISARHASVGVFVQPSLAAVIDADAKARILAARPLPIIWRVAANQGRPTRPARVLLNGLVQGGDTDYTATVGATCDCSRAEWRVRSGSSLQCVVPSILPPSAPGQPDVLLVAVCSRLPQ